MALTIKYSELEIVELVNRLLHDARLKRASDIHFEPYQEQYRVRMRIDGVLQTIVILPILLAKPLAVRLKIMGSLNIAEQRLPQDGQLVIDKYAMRISSIPTLYGEKIVLRVMENHQDILSLEKLGLSAVEQYHYQQALNNPQGLILVTGPTGSGKTITLYSGLKQINTDSHNICSVEDPVEMPIDGINQTQINPKAGLDFAKTLRSFLRQDPDVIMIGEIRDQETAEISVQAAQTGHLVLSTLHTNSSAEALVRLNQMGIKNYLLASSLKLVIAQRLARKLCPHCKTLADDQFIIEDQGNTITYSHYLAKGCTHCIGGYYGRIGLYELLIITPQIQTLLTINTDLSLNNLQQLMKQLNIKTLYLSGLELIKQGTTSLNELQRVLGTIYG